MTALQSSAAKQLRTLVERIERMEEEKKARADDVKDIYLEAKSAGFDVKALRKIIALRKMDKDEREELESIITLYMGHLEGTPLGNYAAKQQLETV